MSVQLTKTINGTHQTRIDWDVASWRYQIHAHGAGEIEPNATVGQVVEDLAKKVTADAKAARPAKGQAAQGMQLLASLPEMDKAILKAQKTLAQARVRLVQIAEEKRAAVGEEPDGAKLLNRIAALDAEQVRTQATVDQLAQDVATKQRARDSLVPSIKTDLTAAAGAAVHQERKLVQEKQAQAFADLEAAMAPHLQNLAECQAKLLALDGTTPPVWAPILAKLDQALLAPAVAVVEQPEAVTV